MAAADSPRAPPPLGPAFKSGSLRLDFDLRPTTTVNILETYSPFPSFGNTRDPFGLDTFLLHPADVPWEYLRSSPIPGDELLMGAGEQKQQQQQQQQPKKKPDLTNRLSMLRRPSPLASNPPLSAGIEEEPEDESQNDGEEAQAPKETSALTPDLSPPRNSRPLSMAIGSGGKAIRSLVGGSVNRKNNNPLLTPESETPDTMPSTPEDEGLPTDSHLNPPDRRSMYSLSGSSSEDSCDGPHTPTNNSATDVSARLAAALQEDQQRLEERELQQHRKVNNRTSWRDWLGGRRTSFLGLRGGESGNTLLESPRASVVDLIEEEDVAAPADSIAGDSELARSAAQLRRLSLVKLGSLRMPSPHPLARALAPQSAHLPNEVAFAIPSSRRVYPKSVNAFSKSEPQPASPGLRVALGLRDVIQRIDAGERPTQLLSMQRKPQPRQSRSRGVRDFVDRRPFEERNVVYYPDNWVEEVSMARPAYAIWDIDFSNYILALAETEERPPRNYSLRPTRPKSQAKSLPSPPQAAAPMVKVTKAEESKTSPIKSGSRLSTAPAAKAPARASMPPPSSSFRNARSKPSTWDDSSDEEEHSGAEVVNSMVPVRPAQPTRTQTAPAVPTATASNARARQSRLIDPSEALKQVTGARDRRHEANLNHVARKAVTDQRRVSTMILEEKEKKERRSAYSQSVYEMKRPSPSKRVSSMTLSADAAAPGLNRRRSTQTLAAIATSHSASQLPSKSKQRTPPETPTKSQNRPAASLPSSPRIQASDRRRVVSQYEQPVMNSRASISNLSMHGQPTRAMAAVPTITPYHTGMTPMHTGMPMVPMHTGMPMAPMHTGMSPMMGHRASMMYPAVPMVPMPTGGHAYAPHYTPQFAGGAQLPQMYLQPPLPNTGRRRERPVA